MKGSAWQAPAAACVLAAVLAGTALAANSGSFSDSAGDGNPAPDVTGVAIANDDSGTVTIKVTLANRSTLSANDSVDVGIDADQNPDTGSVFYGTEFELDLDGSTPRFLRASADGFFQQAAAPASLQASSSGGVVTFSFKTADLGITSGFAVYALGFSQGAVDTAPDIRTFNYQLVAGTAPPALAADTRAPLDEAVKMKGVHGKTMHLLYFAADGRGETTDTVVVYRGSRVMKRIVTRLEDTNPFFPYWVPWRVPGKLRGKLRFCVRSADRAGNKSNQSCASLTIR
jgi:hypothetical protein